MARHRLRRIRGQSRRPALGPWLLVGAGALALLALSQALWLWQTWPVRELLQ